MLEFIVATYNEDEQINSLLHSVHEYVDRIHVVDDGSTDNTLEDLHNWVMISPKVGYIPIDHTGLPETVKKKAIELCQDNSWVLMLDCDERITRADLEKISSFVNSDFSSNITHVWFDLIEFIDDVQTRSFLKCRLFRKNAVIFSNTIHEDDVFIGEGANFHWKVWHTKTSNKQRMREHEYIATYKKLLAEGKITPEWAERAQSFHYFIKNQDLVPHG